MNSDKLAHEDLFLLELVCELFDLVFELINLAFDLLVCLGLCRDSERVVLLCIDLVYDLSHLIVQC